MSARVVLSALVFPALGLFVSMAQLATSPAVPGQQVTPAGVNSTTAHVRVRGLDVDSNMIQRALYVLIGITTVGMLYFLVRAVRLKQPPQRKRYGLLANAEDGVEMDALDSDEDNTLYEARSLRR